MAIRTNASGEYARRTANLPSSTSYTACGWAMISTDRNDYSSVFELGNATSSSSGYHILETNSDGTSLIWANNAGFASTGVSWTVGTWYFWAIAVSGVNAAQQVCYLGGKSGTLTATNAANTIAGFTSGGIWFGNNSYDEWLNGRVAAVKVWDAVLTQAEIEAERHTYVPRRKTNVNFWCPLFVHSTMQDYGPNGRNLSAGGTLSTEEGPPIIWDYVRPRWSPYVVASGGGGGGNRRRRVLLSRAA